jgi:hypothetical protein
MSIPFTSRQWQADILIGITRFTFCRLFSILIRIFSRKNVIFIDEDLLSFDYLNDEK